MLNPNCAHSKRMSLLVLVTFCATLLSSLMLGQSTLSTGAIRGTVLNQVGRVVAGAKIIITNKSTARVLQAVTSSNGMYALGPLPPGNYTLRVEAKGFKTVLLEVSVRVAAVADGNINLEQGEEKAVVPGVETTVNIEQATVQTVLRSDEMNLLPFGGRNYLDLAQLAPGIQFQDGDVVDPSKSGLPTISVNSRTGRGVRTELDGVDVTDETVVGSAQNVAASAIQEFNVSRSFLDLPTEPTSSGTVNISTRSGGNDLHGEAFGFFRGDQTAARLPGLAPTRFQRQQFGGRVGGAIIKNKLFWFLDAERTKQDLTEPEPFSAPFDLLPTSAAQPFRDSFLDGRLDWQGRNDTHAFYRFSFDEVSQIRPFGAFSSLQDTKNALHTPSNVFGYDFTTGRYTHSIRFEYLRMSDGVSDVTGTIPAGINNPFPGLGINIGAPVQGSCALSSGGAFCGGPSQFGPQVTIQTDLQAKYDGSRMLGKHLFRYGGTLNRIHAGGFASLFTSPQAGTTTICLPGTALSTCVTNADPTAYAADFVSLGNGIGFSTPQSAFGYAGGGLGPATRIEGYIGDEWKAGSHVTLTYGVRYLHDPGRVDSGLGPEAALNLWQPGLSNTIRNPKADFAPQFGFAWDVDGIGKTVIRGGGGLYYDTSLWTNMLADSRARRAQGLYSYTPQVCSYGNPSPFAWPTNPGAVGSSVAGGAGVVVGTDQFQPTFCGGAISDVGNGILALSNAFKVASAAGASAQSNPNYSGVSLSAVHANGFDVFDPNYRTPRAWQINFGFEHDLGPGATFTVDYVRSVGEHNLMVLDANHSGAARSYNVANAVAARDKAQTNAATLYHGTQNCPPVYNQAQCMISSLGLAGAQAAYSAAGLDANSATAGGGPCSFCAFPGITPFGINNSGGGVGNGALGTLDTLATIGRSVYQGVQAKLVQRVENPFQAIKAANFEVAYTLSEFESQGGDLSLASVAINNDNPLQFTGPNGMDREHQISFAGTFELPFFTRISFVGHIYSPLSQSLLLPQLTNGGEIYATDWLGSGLTSGSVPEPLPGTQIGQIMRTSDISDMQKVVSNYNTHFAGTLTPAGHCLVADQGCPGGSTLPVMTMSDMSALGWVMPSVGSVSTQTGNFPWLETVDARISWPIKIKDRITVQPSASIYNVLNIYNAFTPGNVPLASLVPGGPAGTLAPYVVGGVMKGSSLPFRSTMQSGTYALGAPRQIEFGLRVEF